MTFVPRPDVFVAALREAGETADVQPDGVSRHWGPLPPAVVIWRAVNLSRVGARMHPLTFDEWSELIPQGSSSWTEHHREWVRRGEITPQGAR